LAALAVVSAALLQRFGPDLRPGPPVGSGGYLGALAVAFLDGHFGPAGMLLILAATGLVGLVFCYDAFFLWPFQEVVALVRRFRPPAKEVPHVPQPTGTGLMIPVPNFAVVGSDP